MVKAQSPDGCLSVVFVLAWKTNKMVVVELELSVALGVSSSPKSRSRGLAAGFGRRHRQSWSSFFLLQLTMVLFFTSNGEEHAFPEVYPRR